MWLLLWCWVEEVLFTNLLPKGMWYPSGIQKKVGTPAGGGRSLRGRQNWGKMLGIRVWKARRKKEEPDLLGLPGWKLVYRNVVCF